MEREAGEGEAVKPKFWISLSRLRSGTHVPQRPVERERAEEKDEDAGGGSGGGRMGGGRMMEEWEAQGAEEGEVKEDELD